MNNKKVICYIANYCPMKIHYCDNKVPQDIDAHNPPFLVDERMFCPMTLLQVKTVVKNETQ